VPDGVKLSALQDWFITLYNSADGWYLIPPLKFMSMAQCCLLAFIVAAAMVLALVLCTLWVRFRKDRAA